MGRYSSVPDLFDECQTIDIGRLSQWGYLQPGQNKSGSITWSRNGNKTGCIDIGVNTLSEDCYSLTLSYNYMDKPVLYMVPLVSVPSNLGKGKVWYFVCPLIEKRCRKLYRLGAKFLHRDAHPFALYESQTYSHKNRALLRLYDKKFGSDKAYDQIYSKHFKTHYAGRLTKRYQRLLKKIEESKSVSFSIEELMLM